MSLQKLLNKGNLERLEPDKDEIANLLIMANLKLDDAGNQSNSPATRLSLAYQVILTCCTIALRACGYRAKVVAGKHRLTVDTAEYTLGEKRKTIHYFHILRKKRNEDMYEGLPSIGKGELSEALTEAKRLLKTTTKWLSQNYPNLI